MGPGPYGPQIEMSLKESIMQASIRKEDPNSMALTALMVPAPIALIELIMSALTAVITLIVMRLWIWVVVSQWIWCWYHLVQIRKVDIP